MGTRGRRSDHNTSQAVLWIPAGRVATGSEQESVGRCDAPSSQASAAVLWLRRLGPKATTSRKPSLLRFTSELLICFSFLASTLCFMLWLLMNLNGPTQSQIKWVSTLA